MKRPLLIALLSLGTVGGFAHGFHSLRHHHHRRAQFERHVARVCVEAAREADAAQEAPPPPPHHGRRHHGPHR
ncbi:MAG: hypothetical protein H6721_23490 [Sandaracinus sp.]|nr:hypothetical protein [Sandaracinus sp.]MCB9635101.1 hypothetical protein [Sandaracinus sp.]